MDESYSNCYQKFTRALAIRAKWGHFIRDRVESVFVKFVKFVNQTSKTLEIDESEARHHESESLRFVEFAVQFVREIRKIRLQISPVAIDIGDEVLSATEEPLTKLSPRESCIDVQKQFKLSYQGLVWYLGSLNLNKTDRDRFDTTRSWPPS